MGEHNKSFKARQIYLSLPILMLRNPAFLIETMLQVAPTKGGWVWEEEKFALSVMRGWMDGWQVKLSSRRCVTASPWKQHGTE